MSIQVLAQFMPTIFSFVFMVGMTLSVLSYSLSVYKSLKKDWKQLQKLHQIPCDRCVFFTGEYNLKCTVHPYKALKEEAIDCVDYRSTKSSR